MRTSFLTCLILFVTRDIISVNGEKYDHKYTNKLMYNDGSLVFLNEVKLNEECRAEWKNDIDQNKFIPPIGMLQIRCLLSIDRHCSKSMARIKGILIRALRDDCAKCSIKEKDSVGKIVASMWTHDSDSWKLFLKKYGSKDTIQRII